MTKTDIARAAGLIYEFRDLTNGDVKGLRLIFNNFPFAWFEAGRSDGYYQVHSALPASFLMESLRFLNSRLKEIVGGWKVWTTDLTTSHTYTFPYENFDNKRGWFFEADEVLSNLMPSKMKMKENRRTWLGPPIPPGSPAVCATGAAPPWSSLTSGPPLYRVNVLCANGCRPCAVKTSDTPTMAKGATFVSEDRIRMFIGAQVRETVLPHYSGPRY